MTFPRGKYFQTVSFCQFRKFKAKFLHYMTVGCATDCCCQWRYNILPMSDSWCAIMTDISNAVCLLGKGIDHHPSAHFLSSDESRLHYSKKGVAWLYEFYAVKFTDVTLNFMVTDCVCCVIKSIISSWNWKLTIFDWYRNCDTYHSHQWPPAAPCFCWSRANIGYGCLPFSKATTCWITAVNDTLLNVLWIESAV